MIHLETTLDWAEYLAVVASLVVSVVLSFRFYEKTTQRSTFSLGPILMSLIASSTSGVTMLGKPAESYAHGVEFAFFITTSILLDYVVVRLVFLPVILKLKTASIYEYFDLRFDSRVTKLVSVPYIAIKTLTMSLAVIPPVIVIHQFTGLGETFLTVSLTLLTAFYTMIGGFEGVVWTDTLQGLVMMASMTVLTTLSVVKVGGLGKVFQIASDTDRLSIPPLSFDPTERISIWAYGLFICGLSTVVFNQSIYQRFKALSTEREIRNALMGMILGTASFTLAASFVGLSIYAYYYGCDPKDSKLVDSYSNVIVFWINDVGRKIKGIRGLYIAGITCASLSTMSTHLNTVSQMTCSYLSNRDPPRYLERIVTFGIGLVSMAAALIIKNTGSLVELAFTINCLEGINSGLFILGTLVVSANAKGALAGGLSTIAWSIATVVGTRLTDGSSRSFSSKIMRTESCAHEFNSTADVTALRHDEAPSEVFFLFRLSPFSLGTVATLMTVSIGAIVSLMFHDGPRVMTKADADLFCPCVHRFLKEKHAVAMDEKIESNKLFPRGTSEINESAA